MSKPSAGNYYIVNQQTTSDGKTLAINYNGEGSTLTVTELEKLPTQVWVINNYNSETQSVSPVDATSLQVDSGANDTLTVAPANDYVWAIRGNNGIYTIQDGAFKYFWYLQEATEGAAVSYGAGTGDVKQYWKLESV